MTEGAESTLGAAHELCYMRTGMVKLSNLGILGVLSTLFPINVRLLTAGTEETSECFFLYEAQSIAAATSDDMPASTCVY